MISFSFSSQNYTIISALLLEIHNRAKKQDCWEQLKYGSYSNRFCVLIQHVGYPEFFPPVVLSVGVQCSPLSQDSVLCINGVFSSKINKSLCNSPWWSLQQVSGVYSVAFLTTFIIFSILHIRHGLIDNTQNQRFCFRP